MKRAAALLFLVVAGIVACRKPTPPESGVTTCYIADQFRCIEIVKASAEQRGSLAVQCSSGSGVLSDRCPTAGFKAKCTVGQEVRRWYAGRDVAYEEKFCADPAQGVWSTAF